MLVLGSVNVLLLVFLQDFSWNFARITMIHLGNFWKMMQQNDGTWSLDWICESTRLDPRKVLEKDDKPLPSGASQFPDPTELR